MDKCYKAEKYSENALYEARDYFDCSSTEKLLPDANKIANFPENFGRNAEKKFQCISAEKLIPEGVKTDEHEMSDIYEDGGFIWIKERIIPDDQKGGLFKCCFNINMCRKKKKKPRDFIVEFYSPHYEKF